MPLGESVTKNANAVPPPGTAGTPLVVEGRLSSSSRAALRAVLRLSAERAAAEAAARQSLDSTLSAADAELSSSLSATLSSLERSLAEIRDAGDRGVVAARQGGEEAINSAKLRFEAEKGALRERGESDAAAARKKMQDQTWMAETMHDTTIDKPGAAFAKIKGEVERRSDELAIAARRVEQELQLLVRPSRRAPRPWAEGVIGEDVDAGLSKKELAERFTQLSDEVIRRASAIVTVQLPRAFVAPLPVVYGVVAGAAIVAGVAYARDGRVDAIAAGAGAAGLIGIWIMGEVVRRGQKRVLIAMGNDFVQVYTAATAVGDALIKRADIDRKQEEEAIRSLRDREVQQAKTKYEAVLASVNAVYQQARGDLEVKLKEQLIELAAKREADIAAAEAERRRQLADADAAFRASSAAAKVKHQQTRDGALAANSEAFGAYSAAWVSGMTNARATLDDNRRVATVPSWHKETLSETDWPMAAVVPPCVPVGRVVVELAKVPDAIPADARLHIPGDSALTLPIAMELPDRCSLLLQVGGGAAGINEARAAGLTAMRAAMLRLLLTFPPGKVRFTILDPVGLGQNFAAFMHLADFDPLLVADRIWTEPRHIEQRLTDLTEHMETVIQKYLRNEFASIEEYNARAGEVAEPYRILVVADFPAAFNENSAKRLASIIGSGPKCGVYTLIMHDTRQQLPQGITAADLKKAAVRLAWRKPQPELPGRFVVDDADLTAWPLELDPPPHDERFNELVRMAGRRSKDAGRVQVPFASIAPTRDKLWSLSTSSEVTVALGRAGATRLQHMTLGRGTAQHMLIAGRTGSGKSTLLHVIITNLALWYSPDEIELYLVDFKKGVEFKAYAGDDLTPQLPHARVIAIESEREFGLSVLRRLDAELKRRGELLRDSGVQDIKSYRQTPGAQIMPRTLLIVDEFQEIFVEDDKIAQEASLLLDRLVRQGRAFGMHVILGSQTLGGAYSLARATMGQMGVRIALQCSEADSYLILSEDNAAARLLTRPGEALYNDASGALEGNNLFQISWLEDTQRDDALRTIAAAVTPEMSRRLVPPIVFEGNVPARVQRTHELELLLSGRASVPAGPTGQPLRVHVYLGDPVAIKEPTSATFRRQAAANLLIVGQQEESALAMLSAAAVGIAGQHLSAAGHASPRPTTAASIYLFDGTAADAHTAGTLDRLAASMPAAIAARGVPYRDVPSAINEISDELKRRQEGDITDASAIYLIIHGLQRFRVLRRPEDEFDFSSGGSDAPKPDKQFMQILKEGPSFGIHVLCWCDTATTLTRTLERGAVREFDARVLFQMSAADASSLVDAPGANVGLIGQNRAIIASEEQGTVEKFRPYALPPESWLMHVKDALTKL